MRRILYLSFFVLIALSSCKKDNQKAIIVGILKTDSGETLALADVFLKQDDLTIQQTITDDNGSFKFDEISTGDYTLKAYTEKYKYSKPIAISVTEGNLYEKAFVFEPILSIDGTLLDPSSGDIPFEKVRVELYEKTSLSIVDFTMSDRNGKFYFYDLKPGVYEILAYELYYFNWYSDYTLNIENNETKEVIIELIRRTVK